MYKYLLLELSCVFAQQVMHGGAGAKDDAVWNASTEAAPATTTLRIHQPE
jgi:hypothetical protein